MQIAPDAQEGPRRIGFVEDHVAIIRDYLKTTVSECPDLEIVDGAETVTQLLEKTTDLDLVVLDLAHLPDKSKPADNVAALRRAGIHNIIVLTVGDQRHLIQQAAKSGVLSIVRKKAARELLIAALRSGAAGDPMPTIDWAASIDHDPHAPEWDPRQGEIIELYATGLLGPDIAKLLGISMPELIHELKKIIEKYRLAPNKVPDLSPRELEVLRLYAYGDGAKEIAQILPIREHTVRTHIKNIKAKYERVGRPCNTKAEIRKNAIADGFIEGPRS
ncbi:response regulator transcription factor [Nocardia neocaledoniensis]|uniref:response regulator transcription factor n=1 Tax=Nocardia neocaledoniensis TaxID=236511 RepID=UPI002459076B|nr:response regulator transcription factor [Nocardia neocaledoniensis]